MWPVKLDTTSSLLSALLIASHWLMMAFYCTVCLHQPPIVRINGQRWNKTDKLQDTASSEEQIWVGGINLLSCKFIKQGCWHFNNAPDKLILCTHYYFVVRWDNFFWQFSTAALYYVVCSLLLTRLVRLCQTWEQFYFLPGPLLVYWRGRSAFFYRAP